MVNVNLSLITRNVSAWVAQETDPAMQTERIHRFFSRLWMLLLEKHRVVTAEESAQSLAIESERTPPLLREGRALTFTLFHDSLDLHNVPTMEYVGDNSAIRATRQDDAHGIAVTQDHAILFHLGYMLLRLLSDRSAYNADVVSEVFRPLESGIPDSYNAS